jgi:DNA helicase-2/ATP-dependent DNA helicase PcrA
MQLLDGLNKEQIRAVEHTNGPLLILAGAGSGKTKTLTHRLAYLIDSRLVSPHEIMAVTFTNKAANEMRQRTLKLLGRDPGERHILPFMGTFHSLCVRILRMEAENANISNQFVIFDAQDSKAAIKQVMKNLNINEKQFAPALLQSLISSAKNELIGPQEYRNLSEGRAQETAAKVYPDYQKLLLDASALDFDDLLFETVNLFKQNSQVLARWQQRFKHVLVDEYQDTNFAQYQLTKLLSQPQRNICVVGDDWQSIYSWRGANFKNILDFTKDYTDAKVIKLEQNYRSSAKILEAAQAVITRNRSRSDKQLWTDQDGGLPVRIYQLANESEEANQVALMINNSIEAGRSPKDFAVLYRTNAQSRVLEEAFLRYGLPYRVVGGVRFYDRKEIKDIVAYLRFIYQPDDEISFRRIVNVPPRGIGARSLEQLQAWRVSNNLSLAGALARAADIAVITPRARESLNHLYQVVTNLRELSQGMELDKWIELVAKRSGYFDYLDDGSIQAGERLENVKELFSLAKGYNNSGGLESFLEEVALLSDIDSYDPDSSAVTLMTLHAAKGLEFPIVFMIGMEEGVFPHSRSLYDEQQLEEERRLCYVGITRAREELFVLHAASRLLFGNVSRNLPARFIAEMGDGVQIGHQDMYFNSEPVNTKMQADLNRGDRVEHPLFGVGEILDIEGEELTIKFKNSTKQLSLPYAKLTKLF